MFPKIKIETNPGGIKRKSMAEEIKKISDVEIKNKTKTEIKKDDKKIIDKPKPISKPEPDFNLATMLKDLRNEDISNTSNNNNNEEDKINELIYYEF